MPGNLYLLIVGILGLAVGFFAATFLFLLGYRLAQYNYEEKLLEEKAWEREGFLQGTAEEVPDKSEAASASSPRSS